MTNLVDWLKQQKYYDAVTYEYHLHGHYEDANLAIAFNENVSSQNMLKFYTVPSTKKVYLCPRDILRHRGNRQECGQACERARARNDGNDTYEDEAIIDIIIVSKETRVHLGKCIEDRTPQEPLLQLLSG